MEPRSFNERMLAEITASGRCDPCPLNGRVKVGMDDSGGVADERPILFLGLNPGREEAIQGLPFVGKSGRFLRECLRETGIGEDAGWAMVNSILCSTRNESEIPDVGRCQGYCRPNVGAFVKIIKPKVIAPCGNGAANLFGLGSGITVNSRLVFVSRGRSGKATPTAVLPITHPSSLIRNGGRSSPAFGAFIDRLREILKVAKIFDPAAPDYNLPGHRPLFAR